MRPGLDTASRLVATTAIALLLPSSALAQATVSPIGEEVCVTAEVDGASGTVCASREGFGASWSAELADTAEDGLPATARIVLDVQEARDAAAELRSDIDATVVRASGRFAPRIGRSLRSVSIETCVAVPLRRDRCDVSSVTLPQARAAASPAQWERLDELIFGLSLVDFIETWSADERDGVDATFDWSSDGCSAGPLRDLFPDDLQRACIRHDFAYRNLGQMGLAPSDEVRARVDAQLAADIESLELGPLAAGFEDGLQRFGGPVFFGEDLAILWGVPDVLASGLGTPELEEE